VEQKAMKKSLAIALWCLLCLPAFGQATYYGNGLYSGSGAYGTGTGALLTYAARTDNCETGSEPSGPYGCNPSATTGQQGATLSYLGRNFNLVSFTTDSSGIPTFTASANTFVLGQTVSFQYAAESWLNSANLTVTTIIDTTHFKTSAITGHNSYSSGAEPTSPQALVTDTLPSLGGLSGAGSCITDPDFGARICRVTDYTNFSSAGLSWNLGSDGSAHRLSADSPPSMLLAQNTGGGQVIIALTYSGSGASTVITPTLTALAGNSDFPGAAYALSASNPTVLWELVEAGYDWTTTNSWANPAATCNPPDAPANGSITPYSGITCEFVVQLNRLTLGCTGAGTVPLCSGSALGIVSRAKVFNFNCEGAGCPTTAASLSSPNCLPFNWAADWNGIFLVSDDDTSMTVSFSDDGQAGKWYPNGTCGQGSSKNHCLGASKMVNWTLGQGCRVLSTDTMTVTGDWGQTGAAIDGQPNVITQVAGQALPEILTLHEGEQSPDAAWAVIGAGTNPSCASDSRTPATVTGWSYNISGGLVNVTTDTANAFLAGEQVDFSGATGSGYTWINNGYYAIGTVTDSTHFTLQSIAGHTGTLAQSADFTAGTVKAATSPACSCAQNGTPFLCNAYYWRIADLTVNPCGTGDQSSPCQGHNARGFVNDYRGKYYTANSHSAPSTFGSAVGIPNQDANGVPCPNGECRLFPAPFPADQAGSYQNHGPNDQPPVFMVTQNPCGAAVGNENYGACDPEYTAAWYDEFDAGENYVMNPNAKNCGTFPSGSPGTAPCNYRFAHTGNWGDSWNFNVTEAIGVISKDGKVAVWPTDWGHGFGCTDGTAGPCLSSLQATAPPDETITAVSVDPTGTYLTVTTSGTVNFVVGQRLTFTGTGEPWINSTNPLVVTSVASPAFTGTGIPAGHGSFTNASDAGTAKAVTCASSPSMPCQRADLVIVALPTAHQ